MKKMRYAIYGVIVSIILATGLYNLIRYMDLSRTIGVIFVIIVLVVGTYLAIYYQKLQKPHCEQCDKKLKLISKEKTSQDEEISNGKFVFINTYDYEYHCDNCKSNIKISKKIKMK